MVYLLPFYELFSWPEKRGAVRPPVRPGYDYKIPLQKLPLRRAEKFLLFVGGSMSCERCSRSLVGFSLILSIDFWSAIVCSVSAWIATICCWNIYLPDAACSSNRNRLTSHSKNVRIFLLTSSDRRRIKTTALELKPCLYKLGLSSRDERYESLTTKEI